MLLAIVHLRNKLLDYEYNFNSVVDTYIQAVNSGAELVIFPESALSGYAVIDSNTVDWIDSELLFMARLLKYVKQKNVPIAIGGHFYDNVYSSVEAYFLLTISGMEILKTKERHNCIQNPDFEITNDGKMFSINGTTFSTVICSESMCTKLLDSALDADIILNPSAYGEDQNPINYPLISKRKDFDNKIIIVPNLSMIDDEYPYGRTLIKKGNNILFERSALQNIIIMYNTETGDLYERH